MEQFGFVKTGHFFCQGMKINQSVDHFLVAVTRHPCLSLFGVQSKRLLINSSACTTLVNHHSSDSESYKQHLGHIFFCSAVLPPGFLKARMGWGGRRSTSAFSRYFNLGSYYRELM